MRKITSIFSIAKFLSTVILKAHVKISYYDFDKNETITTSQKRQLLNNYQNF
jgi:hypothetical protein